MGQIQDCYSMPHIQRTCCKIFNHRLDTSKFILRPSQKKVIKRWEKFLADNCNCPVPMKKPSNENFGLIELFHEEEEEEKQEDRQNPGIKNGDEKISEEKLKLQISINQLLEEILENNSEINEELGLCLTMSDQSKERVKVLPANSKKFGQYSTNLLLLLYSENKIILEMVSEIQDIGTFCDKVSGFIIKKLSSSVTPFVPKLQPNGYVSFTKTHQNVQETPPPLNLQSQTQSKKKVVQSVQKDKILSKNNTGGLFDLELEAKCEKLEIKLVKAEFDEEALEVYRKHCDGRFTNKKESSKSEKTFRDFFCHHIIEEQTRESEIVDDEGRPKILQIGCYHMKYYIEGKLIAMGVLDIIPTGMQSVYFFYDPDYSFLALGTVSVLKEIDYMRRMQKYFPEFKHYYLADYVQNCQRLKYKVEYEPAELLCPITRTWVKFDEKIRNKIDTGDMRLAEWNVKVAEDFDFTDIDFDQYVMWTMKINSQRFFEMNPELAARYLPRMNQLLEILGKKLFEDINFKVLVVPPRPVVPIEPKQEENIEVQNLNANADAAAETEINKIEAVEPAEEMKTTTEIKIGNTVLMVHKTVEEKIFERKTLEEEKIIEEEKMKTFVKVENDGSTGVE